MLPYENGMIDYVYSADSGVAFFHDSTGSFVFLKPNQLFTITLKATDGHGAKAQVTVMARYPQN